MKRLLALLVATLLIAGCSKPEDAFIGEWIDREEGISIEFMDGGTMLFSENDDESESGRYDLLDDNRMALEITESDGDTESVVVTYRFEDDGDTLYLTAEGDTIRMTRAD